MAKFEYMQRAFSSELKPRARLVLQVLVLHCNKEGECFPSIKTIAAKCGYGVSTVKRALDELVKAGYIVKQARFDERSIDFGIDKNEMKRLVIALAELDLTIDEWLCFKMKELILADRLSKENRGEE